MTSRLTYKEAIVLFLRDNCPHILAKAIPILAKAIPILAKAIPTGIHTITDKLKIFTYCTINIKIN